MARVSFTDSDVALVARMMRAEAEGEGKQGMLYVGNVITNRAVADPFGFQGSTNHTTGHLSYSRWKLSFEAVQKGNLFYNRARESEKRLARKTLTSWRQHPAKYALWYFNPYAPCPPTWYNQPFAGQFKQHCYYEPIANTCDSVYTG